MHLRPAQIGDIGTVSGSVDHGSITMLVIRIDDDTEVFLYGDWRMIKPIVAATLGERVEVVEGDGSLWGAHHVRAVTDDDPQVYP